jgi:bisphosphoglycerate-dependent phosphoglycerate mutase
VKSPPLLLILLFLLPLFSFSQSSYSISGIVTEDNKSPLPFANVLLLQQKDSALVKGSVTNEYGNFIFEKIQNGNYLIMVSVIGYSSSYSKPFNLTANYKAENIILTEGESLNEVIVQADKPLYSQKIDRMVINVENSIVSAGGSALEILERSPGVVVNKQSSSISVVGKDGVVVMINGKTSYVPASGLIQLLEGMSADNISSIELITTPPANFDAEGNAGFINIVLKERTDIGLNGSYSLSAGYGKGETTSDNINFNYRKNKINIFGSYSFQLNGQSTLWKTSREYELDNNFLTTSTVTNRDPTQRDHNARMGIDLQVSDKTVMGILLNGYDTKWTMDAFNESFDTSNGAIISYVELVNDELNHWKHFGANYNLKHNFTDDKFISFDVDYLYYKDNNPTNYENSFFDENRTFINTEFLRSGKVTPLKTYVSKFDYSNKINKKIKIEAGIKGTLSDFKNDVSVENLVGIDWIIDPTLTNKSNLDEKIFAIYGALDYTIDDKTSVKFGLRHEYTDSQLDTDTEGKVVDRQYGIFFPSAYINRKLNDNLNMNLSYSKRITRPTFNDLAPFVLLVDPNTFLSGNSALQPAISNSIKYDISYKSYVLAFQYTNEDSAIASFQERIDEVTGRLIFEASNLDYINTFAITLGFPIKVNSWWRMQNNFNFVDQKIRSFYNGEPIELTIGNFTANTSQSFKLSDSFSGEFSAFYTSKSFFGTAIYDEVYRVNIGFQKKFNDKWGSLKFSVNDIFDSFEFNGGTDLPDQNIKTRNLFDFGNRTFLLTYSRNFGNKKLKSSRERKTGAEEERRRVN